MSETQKKTWACKIGEVDPALVPDGADLPMRRAVKEAFTAITGEQAEFVFSGWAATLDETERAVVESREPSPEHYADWLKREAAPELYEALKAAVEIIDKWIEPEAMGIVRSGDGVLGHCLRDEYLVNFRAALLKATPERHP